MGFQGVGPDVADFGVLGLQNLGSFHAVSQEDSLVKCVEVQVA